jgi:preprotein translocase subunit SecE
MARKPGSSPSAIKNRAAKTAAALATPLPAAPAAAKAPAAPEEAHQPRAVLLREVRAEARKITWTTRKETWITSVMVFIMVVWRPCSSGGRLGCLGFGANQLLKLRRGIRDIMRHRNRVQPEPQVVHRPRLLELREEGGREHP